MSGLAGPGPRPDRPRGRARRPRPPRRAVPRLHDLRARRRSASAPAARCSSRPCPTCRSTRGARAVHAGRALRRARATATATPPTRGSTPGSRHRGHGPRPATPAGAGAARQLDRRRARRVHPRAPDRRGDGRPRADARRPGVRRRGPARPRPRRARPDGRHRRRARRDGGREPRRPARRPGRRTVLDGVLETIAAVPSFRPDITAWAASPSTRSRSSPTRAGRWASRPGTTATSRRTRSARRSRSTSATRSARTCCWRSAGAGSCSCPAPPAPCRRSSRRRAPTTTPRRPRWCRWSSSAGTTGRRTLPAWPLVDALADGPALRRQRPASSTPRTRPSACWSRHDDAVRSCRPRCLGVLVSGPAQRPRLELAVAPHRRTPQPAQLEVLVVLELARRGSGRPAPDPVGRSR